MCWSLSLSTVTLGNSLPSLASHWRKLIVFANGLTVVTYFVRNASELKGQILISWKREFCLGCRFVFWPQKLESAFLLNCFHKSALVPDSPALWKPWLKEPWHHHGCQTWFQLQQTLKQATMLSLSSPFSLSCLTWPYPLSGSVLLFTSNSP